MGSDQDNRSRKFCTVFIAPIKAIFFKIVKVDHLDENTQGKNENFRYGKAKCTDENLRQNNFSQLKNCIQRGDTKLEKFRQQVLKMLLLFGPDTSYRSVDFSVE
jgi:hypothetical protein